MPGLVLLSAQRTHRGRKMGPNFGNCSQREKQKWENPVTADRVRQFFAAAPQKPHCTVQRKDTLWRGLQNSSVKSLEPPAGLQTSQSPPLGPRSLQCVRTGQFPSARTQHLTAHTSQAPANAKDLCTLHHSQCMKMTSNSEAVALPRTQLGPRLPVLSPAAPPLGWHTRGPQPPSPLHLLAFGMQGGEGSVRQVLDLQQSISLSRSPSSRKLGDPLESQPHPVRGPSRSKQHYHVLALDTHRP